MKRFFDTNVLLYAVSPDEPRKCDLARACIDEATEADEIVLSTQVLAEFYKNAVRRKLLGPAQAQALVRNWSDHDVVVQTPDLILRAIALHQQHALEFWDALVIQAALDARCDVLLSEDMQHGRRFGELEICNPFVASAAHEPPTRAYPSARSRKSVPRRR